MINRLPVLALLLSGFVTTSVVLFANSGLAKDTMMPSESLKPVTAFDRISDPAERSVAIFGEIGKVVKHPRCANCHPRGNTPHQGEIGALHQPKVIRGEGGMGATGMICNTCHGVSNFRNVPGNRAWHLAPAAMAWSGVPLAEICKQIKDPQRNGGMSMDALHHHMTEDGLVGYAWNPPAHLEPAPGTQKQLGKLTRAWIDSGAHCPAEGDEQ